MNKKINFLIGLILLLVLIGVITILAPVKGTKDIKNEETSGIIVSDNINEKNLEFIFICKENNFTEISFQFATFEKILNNGDIKFDLFNNKTGKLLDTRVILAKDIEDNQYENIKFRVQENSKNETYRVQIKTENLGDPITLWASENGLNDINTILDGTVVSNLAFKIKVEKNSYPYTWDIFLIIAILIVTLSMLLGKTQANYDTLEA